MYDITLGEFVGDLSIAVDKFMARLVNNGTFADFDNVETEWSKLFVEVQKLKNEIVLERARGLPYLQEHVTREYDVLQKRVHDLDYAIRLLSDAKSSLRREGERFDSV